MQIARLILDRALQLLQRRINGAALRVSQHNDQSRAELYGGELDAADQRWSDNVAAHANHEQVPQSLIEDDFNRDAGIGATENGGERLLTRGQLETARPARNSVAIADVRHEAPVSLLQK